jgi:hypothetical protein
MACCAGKAPHKAGSCTHDACESPISIARPKPQPETLCGLTSPSVRTRLSEQRLSTRASKAVNPVSVSSWSRSCPPDCGGALSAFTNQNRPRNSVVISHAEKALPPSDLKLVNADTGLTQLHSALCRKSAGRAPPSLA